MKVKVIYILTITTMSFILLITGCMTKAPSVALSVRAPEPVPRKTYIDQAIWANTTRNKVYDACVTALHMESFGVSPMRIKKESGIIIPNPVRMVPHSKNNKTYYSLQILVAELKDSKVMVDIKIKAGGNIPSSWSTDAARIRVDNKLSEDLGKFFTRLDALLGKAEYYRDNRLYQW
ncbi:MAG: hypothetical protein KAH24_07915 [Holophagae bacterium]|nr:hypothetical protein [Holophagae bacterium]